MKTGIHIILPLVTLVLAGTPTVAAVYSWTGAVDGDWTNADNWDANGVPVDANTGDSSLTFNRGSGDRIEINAAASSNPVPTSNIPTIGGHWTTGDRATPRIDLLSGSLALTLQSYQASYWERNAVTFVTVGDGDTGNGTAMLEIAGVAILNRDFGGIQSWVVNADGTLDFTRAGNLQFSNDNNAKAALIILNGGSVNINGAIDNLATTQGKTRPSYVEFNALGSSFTAAFGVDFPDLDAVETQVGTDLSFRSTTGTDPTATDNGDGTFTVALVPPPAKFQLTITPNATTPGNYDFSWESQDGKIYDLVSNTSLSTAPATWPVWESQADIVGRAPTNTLENIPGGGDPGRYFAVVEKDAPPVEIFAENFDATTPGSLPADWTTGKNAADNSSLTSWELGTPANVGPVPPGVPLPSAANCVATNISGNYDDPVSDLGVAHTDIWLRSPEINLGAATAGTLSFQQWTQIEDVPGDLDYGSIRILDATDDSELAVMESQSIDGNTTGWEEYSMELPAAAFTATAGTIKVEFQFEADDIDSFAGWYIDDVVVTAP